MAASSSGPKPLDSPVEKKASSDVPVESVIVLAHRGEGVTNRSPDVLGKMLPPRTDPRYDGEILPENSLSAFEHAFKGGANGFECDVFLSKDGIPMVIHDNQLARNVDGHHAWTPPAENALGNVSDFTAAELQEKFTIGNGEKIPTLDELLKLSARYNQQHLEKNGFNLTLNIELKGDPAIARATYDVIENNMKDPAFPFKKDDFLFNSFDEPCISAMLALDPTLRCAIGTPTKELFTTPLIMPGWIPPDDPKTGTYTYTEAGKKKLQEIIEKCGLDMVTSDLKPEVLGPMLSDSDKPRSISLAINALRLHLEAKNKNLPDAEWSDIQREEKEFKKVYDFLVKYQLAAAKDLKSGPPPLVYFKSDDAQKLVEYQETLKAQRKAEIIAGQEKVKAKADLKEGGYDPRLMSSLQQSLRDYALQTQNPLGKELAKSFDEALKEEIEHRRGPGK